MSAGFSFAPASERTLTVGEYLGGALELLVILAALVYAARRVRAALLPGWSGAPALLAELVLVIVALIWLAEALGTVGAFGEVEMIVASVLVAAATAILAARYAGRGAPAPAPTPPAPRSSSIAKLLAVGAGAAVLAGWMVPTLASLAGGMDRADTLWYHMPLSVKFVQTGSIDQLFHFDPIFFAQFYPSHSEILHAVPILAFGRDIVSPVLNLGFLGMGLLASWCIGRPYGVGPQALLGGSVALGAQMLVEFQAGEALNDITGVAFALAAVALLVNGYAAGVGGSGPVGSPQVQRDVSAGALVVAGLAAGLAIGVKLSFLAPVAALTVGVVVIARRGARLRTGLLWSLPMVAAGVYWYARNLITVGNPVPAVGSLGPLELPAPERAFELRPGLSVAHYWNDLEVWWDWFVPGLDESFGVLWPAILIAMVGGAAFALARGREPVLRMLGGMVLFTTVAYLFTPLTAAGEEGEPIAFVWNVRYIAPAAAVAFAFIPCLPAARSTARRRGLVIAALVILVAGTVGSLVQWQQGHVKGALAAAGLVVVAAAVATWMRSRGYVGPAARRRWQLGLAVAALLAVLGAGWFEQRHYLERRYENTSPRLHLAEALRWARDLRGAKVAVAGIRGVFNQYPFYGTDLSNEVQWLGMKGDHDAWLRIPDCERWREEINDGSYTHVVTTYDPFNPGRLTTTKEALWTGDDPATEEILADGPVSVFEVRGELDPAACAGLPSLSPAELNGDSVNAEPLANQPPGIRPLSSDGGADPAGG